jgi:protein TonB
MTALTVRVPHADALNWPRVGAWSGSISIHLLVVVLLLLPGAAVQIARHAQSITPVVDIIMPTPVAPIPAEPAPAPLVKQHRIEPTAPTIVPVAPPVQDAPTFVANVAPPTVDAVPTITAPSETTPSAIAYGNQTHIAYPAEALRNREQGTVLLRVLVGADGAVLGVEIEKSSGSRSLDRAAREAVAKWRFHPATSNGVALSAWASVPVAFDLKSL